MGANQGNVIVSGEVTTESWAGNVETMQNIDLCNGPPVGFGCIELNPLGMFRLFRNRRLRETFRKLAQLSAVRKKRGIAMTTGVLMCGQDDCFVSAEIQKN